jgi:hypothetical protein
VRTAHLNRRAPATRRHGDRRRCYDPPADDELRPFDLVSALQQQ